MMLTRTRTMSKLLSSTWPSALISLIQLRVFLHSNAATAVGQAGKIYIYANIWKFCHFGQTWKRDFRLNYFLQIIKIVFASDNTNSICNFYAVEALLATQQSVNFVVLICGAKILHLCPTSQTQVWQVQACQAKSRGRHAICLLCFQSSFTIF